MFACTNKLGECTEGTVMCGTAAGRPVWCYRRDAPYYFANELGWPKFAFTNGSVRSDSNSRQRALFFNATDKKAGLSENRMFATSAKTFDCVGAGPDNIEPFGSTVCNVPCPVLSTLVWVELGVCAR